MTTYEEKPIPHAQKPIQNVGLGLPTDEDLADIQKIQCFNCALSFNPKLSITFVRLGNRELIWWHRQGTCPAIWKKHTRT